MPALRAPAMQMMTPATGPTGPQGPPGAPGDSGESLEQRMYDLLAPVREVEQDGKGSYILRPRQHECKALILCGNIALLVRHHYSDYGKRINPDDISLVTKNWTARKEENSKTVVENNNNVIYKLSDEIDKQLQQFFPGI